MKPETIHSAMQFALCVALYIVVEPLLRNPEFLLALYGAGALRTAPFFIRTMQTSLKPYREAGLCSARDIVEGSTVFIMFWPVTLWHAVQEPNALAGRIQDVCDSILNDQYNRATRTIDRLNNKRHKLAAKVNAIDEFYENRTRGYRTT